MANHLSNGRGTCVWTQTKKGGVTRESRTRVGPLPRRRVEADLRILLAWLVVFAAGALLSVLALVNGLHQSSGPPTPTPVTVPADPSVLVDQSGPEVGHCGFDPASNRCQDPGQDPGEVDR